MALGSFSPSQAEHDMESAKQKFSPSSSSSSCDVHGEIESIHADPDEDESSHIRDILQRIIKIHSYSEHYLSPTEKRPADQPFSSSAVVSADSRNARLARSFHVLFPNKPSQEWQIDIVREAKKLPFLMRFHAGHFRICLGLSAQTVLFKTVNEASSALDLPLRIPLPLQIVQWALSLLLLLLMCVLYAVKCAVHFEVVRIEFRDRVRMNYLFVPWICFMVLTMGFPTDITAKSDVAHRALWCVFMAPITALEIYVYGQWFTKGKAFLARIANPTTHLSVIGNFVGARMAVHAEWKELAMFFYTVGIVHYVVLFVTLYQRLPTNTALPKNNHPVFFLFVAAPSVSSVAWQEIAGSFDMFSRMQFFLSLFLYFALIVRMKFFRQAMRRFNMVWWAFAYPMTTEAIAAVRYAQQERQPIPKIIALGLSGSAVVAVIVLLFLTILDILMWKQGLFPNDVLIISSRRRKEKGLYHGRDFSSKRKHGRTRGCTTADTSPARESITQTTRGRFKPLCKTSPRSET